MRLGHAWVLTRMLVIFFARKVLSVGALRSPVVRVLLALAVLLLAVVCTGAAYLFLRPMAAEQEVWRLVLETTTVSAVLWTQCAFLFVKVLFMNSEGLLELSFHLPVTARERAVALMAYEAVMVVAVAGAGLFSITAASILVLGPAALTLLVETIVVPVLVTYAVVSLLHAVVLGVLQRSPLRRVAPLIAILALFALLLAYSRALSPLVRGVSVRYLTQDTHFGLVTAPTWISQRWGFVALVVLTLSLLATLVGAVLVVTPRQYVRPSSYVKLWPGGMASRLLTPYDRCLLRSSQTWLAGAAAGGVFLALCLRPVVNPLWALSLLPMGGLYLYSSTEPLRASGLDRSPALLIYVHLVRAQVVLVGGGLALAILPVALVSPASLLRSGPATSGALVAVIGATFIGVAFPADHDNPFSIFIGLSSSAVIAAIVAAALSLLGLEPAVLVAALVALVAVVIAYTVIGIELNQQRSRHEKVTVRHQQPGGRRTADRGHRGGRLAVPHVLDR